jgi:hypothetical protein
VTIGIHIVFHETAVGETALNKLAIRESGALKKTILKGAFD